MNLNNIIIGAENFKYKEFIRSSTATRLGISNLPNSDQWKKIELLVRNILQPIRNEFGPIRITSGFRSIPLCLAIGSSHYSNHARGEASDIEPYSDETSLIDIVNFIYNNLKFRTLILEYFPHGWIHVDCRENGNSKRLKIKDGNHHYKTVSIEYVNNYFREL